MVGQKKALEIWFLCWYYLANEAFQMGLINAVFPVNKLDGEVGRWVRRMGMHSPTALAVAKATINANQDGSAGIALMGGHMTRLFYMSDEAREGRDAYLEGRKPNFRKIPQSKL
jgi:naphthoate synthase